MVYLVPPILSTSIVTSAIICIDSTKTSTEPGLKKVDDIAPIPSAPICSACLAKFFASQSDWH